jgi:hypothetical protein
VQESAIPGDWCGDCGYFDTDFCLQNLLVSSNKEKTVVYILFFVILMPLIVLSFPFLLYLYLNSKKKIENTHQELED